MEKSNSLISSYIGISFVICTMNSYVQVIGDRTIGLEWRTQRGVIDSESRLESRWGQKWRKMIASQRIWIIYWKQWEPWKAFEKRIGKKENKETEMATMCVADRGGSVRSASVEMVWCYRFQ